MKRVPMAVLLCAVLAAANAAHAESLYNESTYRAIGADTKAYRVGDAITVLVYENSSATSSTDTTTQRNNNLSASITSSLIGKQPEFGVTTGGAFDGGGSTKRSSKLLASLTVTVREVLPNGDLKLAGEQMLTVNDEQHKVNLVGRVRPQDVSADNVVLSTRLADAHIDYVGDGDLTERQRRGWWRKVIDWLGF
ncbi:flagellar basal body L-ring protein FlgH [Trinickia fusca]|uniref:Flagellar L-ring protein n=1 Tax=Trinickia fusca TaxID=2419777 RepID=A0A494XCK2_9BURK|nr:flagellar basal body L-ring protein FlgH [Trinickia fusca]RKP48495.1 flagellar basal body L-ring protein FlgH [Trinickia fusca]